MKWREICLFWQHTSGQPASSKLQMTYVKMRGQIKFCLVSEGLKEASFLIDTIKMMEVECVRTATFVFGEVN